MMELWWVSGSLACVRFRWHLFVLISQSHMFSNLSASEPSGHELNLLSAFSTASSYDHLLNRIKSRVRKHVVLSASAVVEPKIEILSA